MRRLFIAFVAFVLALGSGGTLAADEDPPPPGTFSPAGSLADVRWSHTATPLPDGRVLIVGGDQNVRDGDLDDLASAEVWDPTTGAFSPTGSIVQARSGHTATLLPDGRVLVVGGYEGHIEPHWFSWRLTR